MRSSLLTVICLASLAGAGLRAEESPAAAPEQNAIEATKRDIDAIKSTRDAALQPKGDPSRLISPEATGTALDPRAWSPPSRQPRLPEKKGKSANWLVEAMEKEKKLERSDLLRTTRGRSRGESADEEELRDRESLQDAKDRGEITSTPRETELQNQKDERPAPPVVNPLTRYMADWMTPQDFALLKGGTASAAPGDAPSGSGAMPTTALTTSPEFGAGRDLEAAFGLLGTAKPTPATAPRENPFLQGILLSDLPGPAFTPPPMPAGPAPGGAPIFAVPPPAPTPPRSIVPDFVKPSLDDKYFKPLNRF